MSDAPITPEFRAKAPGIMTDIIIALHDFRVSEEDAAAILGNFGTETGGFTLRQEQGKPDKDSTGYGWAQWTGMDPDERRLLFEEWCLDNGYKDVVLEPDDSPEDRYDAACFGYFVHEISKTWEKRVLTDGGTISGVYYPPLKDCSTLEAKTTSFMKLFERPGTPHEDWRHEMAHEALRLYRGGEETPIMPYERIVISSGHGLYVRGASGILDEVDEARKVTDALAHALRLRGVTIITFHDDVSTSQSENLNRITDFHNEQDRDLDISVHFNAYEQVEKPMGTEVLYVTQADLAGQLSTAIAEGGTFLNRGGKYRSDLHFLNATEMPSVLLEVCFVDSEADAEAYENNFEGIIEALAIELSGIEDVEGGEELPERPERPPLPERPSLPERPRPIPRIDIEVSGEVLIYVNGEQVGTKG
jgi:N-acetylmuramoyl-L-alanine amidase